MNQSYGSVKLSKIKAALDSVEAANKTQEDLDISFEYLIGSFFPEILKNIHNECNKQYTAGYIQGQKDANNNN